MTREKRSKKVCILGAGNVGATTAFTLTIAGLASEIVLIDINKDKAEGEAMDIVQGTPFTAPVNIYAGEYSDAANSDIVVVTMGMARKPGQTRIDLAQANVNVVKDVIPEVVKYAPDAVYVVVSNPVDILTYVITKISGLPPHRVVGSGTMLDTARLRTRLAQYVNLNPRNVHAYVFGEHGDTSMIPWSMTGVAGIQVHQYFEHMKNTHGDTTLKIEDLPMIEEDMRTAGAEVIKRKGSTYFAVALSVRRICEAILRNTNSVLTVSTLLTGEYGIEDICLSLPFIVGAHGIDQSMIPPLPENEVAQIRKSAEALKAVRDSLSF